MNLLWSITCVVVVTTVSRLAYGRDDVAASLPDRAKTTRNSFTITELYVGESEGESVERLAENLGLVDERGNPLALTTSEAAQLEERITAVQQFSNEDTKRNETRNALEYLLVKSLHSLIDMLWRKLAPSGSGKDPQESLCNATSCQQNPLEPYCKPLDGSCAECLSDQTCENPSFPFCMGNNCKQCLSSYDCMSNRIKQVCSPGSQDCRECLNDSDCQGKENKKCDTSTFTCVQCVEDTDCDTLYPCPLPDGCPPRYCSSSNVCSACIIQTHCALCPQTPVCGPISFNNITSRSQRVAGSRRLAQFDPDVAIPTACLQCADDVDCARFNGTRNYCESSLCSQCRNDTSCPSESPFCVGGSCKKCPNGEDSCVQGSTCQSNDDCPNSTVPYCGGIFNNSCVECTLDNHCSLPNPVCSANNTCTQCSQDDDCGPPNSFCVEGRCSGCKTDEQCASPLSKCVQDDGICVQCLSSDDCSGDFAGCEPTSRTCVEVREYSCSMVHLHFQRHAFFTFGSFLPIVVPTR